MKQKCNKITCEKYFSIAEQMRISGDYSLDISQYDPKEIEFIATLAQNDGIFNFVKETKDIDVRKLKAVMEFLDAKEKMQVASAQFSDL